MKQISLFGRYCNFGNDGGVSLAAGVAGLSKLELLDVR